MGEFIREFLTYLYTNPSALEQRYPEVSARLSRDRKSGGQSLGNKASDHEACFAHELERRGCCAYPPPPNATGYFYIYQVNGTQRSIDFRLLHIVQGSIIGSVDFDLKHTHKTSIYLNDGRFLDNVIYVISFTRTLPYTPGRGTRKRERQRVCAIAMGQDVLTPKDREVLAQRFEKLRALNAEAHDLDFLRIYARNANQYECEKQFTPDFTHDRFQRTLAWIEPPPPQMPEEPHCQSA